MRTLILHFEQWRNNGRRVRSMVRRVAKQFLQLQCKAWRSCRWARCLRSRSTVLLAPREGHESTHARRAPSAGARVQQHQPTHQPRPAGAAERRRHHRRGPNVEDGRDQGAPTRRIGTLYKPCLLLRYRTQCDCNLLLGTCRLGRTTSRKPTAQPVLTSPQLRRDLHVTRSSLLLPRAGGSVEGCRAPTLVALRLLCAGQGKSSASEIRW